MRIGIVNDVRAASEALRRIVTGLTDHEIAWTASDGVEAVAAAKRDRPDLILMDLLMPHMDGVQATRQITKNPSTSHIPVIIVTTKDQETDRIWGARQGAKSYVTKPVEEELLMNAVNQYLPKP